MQRSCHQIIQAVAAAATAAVVVAVCGRAQPARGDVLFDQTMSVYTNRNNSQIYSTDGSQVTDDTANVDNFVLTKESTLTEVDAALQGQDYNSDFTAPAPGFSFSKVSGYRVEIYSTAAKAQANLVGDVYHEVLPTSSARNLGPIVIDRDPNTLAQPTQFTGLPASVILEPGTYFLSVLAINNFGSVDQPNTNGAVFVATSTSGMFGHDAFLANPGGTNGGTEGLNTDDGYRIEGIVPEPAGWMMLPVIGLLGLTQRRRAAQVV